MIKPTSKPEVNRIAEKASSGSGVGPVTTRFRHLRQINSEVPRVMAIAIDSIMYT